MSFLYSVMLVKTETWEIFMVWDCKLTIGLLETVL